MKGEHGAGKTVRVYSLRNSLPWNRRERVTISLPAGWEGCTAESSATLSDVVQDGQRVSFLAEIPAMAERAVWLRRSVGPIERPFPLQRMENRFLRVTLSNRHMIREILYKPTGTVILSDRDDLLRSESDGTEIPCGAKPFRWEISQFGEMQTGTVSGILPAACGKGTPYRIEMRLEKNCPWLDLRIRLDRPGKGNHPQLCLSTALAGPAGYGGISSPVVRPVPDSAFDSGNEEWEPCRYAAFAENSAGVGVALIGDGCSCSGEGGSRSLTAGLPSSPSRAFSAETDPARFHDHSFRLYFYHGGRKNSGIPEAAQAFGMPLRVDPGSDAEMPSQFRWDNRNIALLSLRRAADGFHCLRLCEISGETQRTVLEFSRPVRLFSSDLREKPGKPLYTNVQRAIITLKPFEVQTLLYQYMEPTTFEWRMYDRNN